MNQYKNYLITGGAGFIGGTFISKILSERKCFVHNIDKINYASDINRLNSIKNSSTRYKHYKLDLLNFEETKDLIAELKPDIVVHFAAESHVDRSIDNPSVFIQNNIISTFNLLEAVRFYFKKLSSKNQKDFLFHHISTDEVYGSLDQKGTFSEKTRYDPRSPYSASKASSDHLVFAWHYSYGIPIKITNCSNNYGPYQFPEKLIPLTIQKCLEDKEIPIYGNGLQVRDWLHVDDHIDGLLKVIDNGKIGGNYCIGGFGEKTNLEVVKTICETLEILRPTKKSYTSLISFVKDRPGHDQRYAIDSRKIQNELGWNPKYDFQEGIKETVLWYLNNQEWLYNSFKKSGYKGERLGL